jgi:LUD domain
VTTFTLPDPGPPNLEFGRPADGARLERTAAALVGRGFKAQVADSAEHARQLVLGAIPEGSEVHIALSETMRELGITSEIDESGRYVSIRSRLNALDRQTQERERRKLGAAPDYIVGSAHAVTDDGEIMVGSGSGSQLGAYAYAGGNVILVVGHQKLVRDVDEGLRRLREYSLPREYVRMQGAGFPGSLLAKTLIIHYEPSGRITVILVPETIGF